MKLSLLSLSILTLAAGRTAADDMSTLPPPAGFESQFGGAPMRPAGAVFGSADAPTSPGGGAAPPTNNYGAINKNASTYNAPEKRKTQSDDGNGGSGTPSAPSAPGGGNKGGEEGGGSGSGGGCSSCKKNLESSTGNLEKKLAEANPNDPATAVNIASGRAAVANGHKALDVYKSAINKVGDAAKNLSEANSKTNDQNDSNQGDIDKLKDAHEKRGQTVQSVQTDPPSCTPGGKGALGKGSPSQANSAQGDLKKAEADKAESDKLSSAAGALAAPVQGFAKTFKAANAEAGKHLDSTGDFSPQVQAVSNDISSYEKATKTLADEAGQAAKTVDQARQKSADTATAIGEANTKSGEADTAVNDKCTEIQGKNAEYLAAEAKVPPDTAKMKQLSSEAKQLKRGMKDEQDKMKDVIAKVKDKHKEAKTAYKDAVKAVKNLSKEVKIAQR